MLRKIMIVLTCSFVWCSPAWADREAPAVPGTYAGAGLPWSTAHPPEVIQGPGIIRDADGRQVDMLGISGGRWGATGSGDELRQLHTHPAGEEEQAGFSFGWLGLLGIAGLFGRRLRRRSR